MVSGYEYKVSNKCVYNVNYHLVWCPKRRSPCLIGNIAEDLKTLIRAKANEKGIKIEAFEVMPDHVHVFVSAKPSFSPHIIVKYFKGAASCVLRKKYPQLQKMTSLWSRSYYCGTVGVVSESVVRAYIDNQKVKR